MTLRHAPTHKKKKKKKKKKRAPPTDYEHAGRSTWSRGIPDAPSKHSDRSGDRVWPRFPLILGPSDARRSTRRAEGTGGAARTAGILRRTIAGLQLIHSTYDMW